MKSSDIFKNANKQCEECGEEVFETYGSGEDEFGEFEDYECNVCGSLTRSYYQLKE